MKIKVKKLHPEAVIPKYAKAGDAGLDLVAVADATVNDDLVATYRTGLSIEIPEGYVGLIYPRSSVTKVGCRLANSVGVIDSGYRGEILVKMDISPEVVMSSIISVTSDSADPYFKGDRIAQLIVMPYPQVELEEVEELSTTERGDGGFGSTGKQ